jgi:hypothetical protein
MNRPTAIRIKGQVRCRLIDGNMPASFRNIPIPSSMMRKPKSALPPDRLE